MPEQIKPANSGDPKGEGSSNVAGVEGKVVLEIEGEKKEFEAKDVENLLAQQAGVTQKAQSIATIIDAAKKYGLDPEDYVGHAEGAFSVMNKLMDDGVIDKEGNLVATGETSVVKKEDPSKVTPLQPKVGQSEDLSIITKALETIQTKMEGLEKDQVGMMRVNLEDKILAKHKELTSNDVSKLVGVAMNDPSKSIWQQAEEMVKVKGDAKGEVRKEFATEFGIDLEKWDANKILEQEAGGGAAAVLAGRKISFGAKRGDKDAVTPKQAMLELMQRGKG